MNLLRKYLFLAIATLIVFSSCQKENIENEGLIVEEPETEVIESNPLLNRLSASNEGFDLDCFSIDFPFEMLDEEGTIYTINSEDDFSNLPEELILADFVYPLNVSYEDGTSNTIEDAEALGEAFASCLPDGGWDNGDFPAYLIDTENSCYELVYPIDLVNDAGNVTTVADEQEFNDALASEEWLYFVFPLTLEHEDGELIEVNNIDEIFETLFSCNGWETNDSTWDWENGFEYIGCYELAFPFDVVVADGSTLTVNDHMEFCDLMLTGEMVDYVYPLTLQDLDGETLVVNNEEELYAAFEECEYDDDGVIINVEGESIIILFELFNVEYYENCYTVNYPIEVLLVDESTITVNSLEELEGIFGNNFEEVVGMELPFSVTLVENGNIVEIDSLEEFFTLTEDCN